jgi:hypothetical protein
VSQRDTALRCRANNMFLSGSLLLTHFGGDIEILRSFLLEERLPDGWEPTNTDAKGLTLIKFTKTLVPVELMTDESKFTRRE